MSAKPLADVCEELKDLRRQGETGESASVLAPEHFARLHDLIEQLPRRDAASRDDADNQYLVRLLDIATLAERVFGDGETARQQTSF